MISSGKSATCNPIAERDLAVAWKAYHQKHAVLRMETWQSNLGGNKGFAAKEKWALKYVRE